MKFYNDFNAMFNAQSGLKKDMSVFNSDWIAKTNDLFHNGRARFSDDGQDIIVEIDGEVHKFSVEYLEGMVAYIVGVGGGSQDDREMFVDDPDAGMEFKPGVVESGRLNSWLPGFLEDSIYCPLQIATESEWVEIK